VISKDELEDSRLLDANPEPFFLGYHRLGQKLQDVRLNVIVSFRKFEFPKYTPVIQELFSDEFIGIPDSGINELFPPPKRGRPRKADSKKRQREDPDLDYEPIDKPQKRNLRRRTQKRNVTGKGPVVDQSSSDSNKVLNISDILLQARDMKTGIWKVFVEWEGLPLQEASWIPLVNLQGLSSQWWQLLRESRYPQFDDMMFPSLPISGPVYAVSSSTETDSASEASSSSDSSAESE